MTIQISENKNWFYLAENSRRTKVRNGARCFKGEGKLSVPTRRKLIAGYKSTTACVHLPSSTPSPWMLAFSGQYTVEDICSRRLENGNRRGRFCFLRNWGGKGRIVRNGVICRCCRPLTANAGCWTNLVQTSLLQRTLLLQRIEASPTLPDAGSGNFLRKTQRLEWPAYY
jgi:hypothetical protein